MINGSKYMNFFGRNIPLCDILGIFITFNLGYSGRNIIPDNMMALMRPISMIIPDY